MKNYYLSETLAPRWAVVEHLHGELRKASPGSRYAEIIEHAIDLAVNLEDPGTDANHLLVKVWHNSRYSIDRGQSRESAFFEKARFEPTAISEQIDFDTPEDIYIKRATGEAIRTQVVEIGPCAERCFQGLTSGESINETMVATGLSRRSVDRYRQKIRRLAPQVEEDCG